MTHINKNQNKLNYLVLLFIFLFSCSGRNYVIYNAVKGNIFDSKNHKPIKDAKIYVNKFASNDFDTIRTNQNGYFFIYGMELPYKYLHYQVRLSYDYHFEKAGYKEKIITIKNLKETKNNRLDTIDMGNIFLEEKK